MNSRTISCCLLSLLVCTTNTVAQDQISVEFEMIPFALGANDMSPDGRWVVGESDWNGDLFPDGSYRWDAETNTYIDLELAVDPTTTVPAVAVSNDGMTVLGNMPDPDEPNDPNAPVGSVGNVAGIWRESTGDWESLGHLPNALSCPSQSSGWELTGDGTMAVGLSWDGCNARAIRWTQATGMVEQGIAQNSSGNCRASIVSDDGTLAAGFCQGSFSRTPVFWDAAGNAFLLDPNQGDALGEIYGMRDDGSMMLGTWAKEPNQSEGDAMMWTPGNGPGGWQRTKIDDGSLLPGWVGIPMDIDDCGTIVGFDFLIGNRRAWITDDSGTIIDLETFITDNGGVIPPGVPLQVCQAISTDGRTIVGHGAFTGAWRVTITRTPACAGDASRDGNVDLTDLALVLSGFGNSGCRPPADVNGDGTVDLTDLAIVLANFGNSCT